MSFASDVVDLKDEFSRMSLDNVVRLFKYGRTYMVENVDDLGRVPFHIFGDVIVGDSVLFCVLSFNGLNSRVDIDFYKVGVNDVDNLYYSSNFSGRSISSVLRGIEGVLHIFSIFISPVEKYDGSYLNIRSYNEYLRGKYPGGYGDILMKVFSSVLFYNFRVVSNSVFIVDYLCGFGICEGIVRLRETKFMIE